MPYSAYQQGIDSKVDLISGELAYFLGFSPHLAKTSIFLGIAK